MQSAQIAEPTTLAGIEHTHGRSRRAPLSWSRWKTSLAGAAAVLACLILPLVLGAISISTEEASADGYIRALYTVRNTPPLATATVIRAAQSWPYPPLLDQHYYFVRGCVASPRDCTNATAGDWGEYYAELQALYEAAAKSADDSQPQPFNRWAKEHTHFMLSLIAPAGAAGIARALAENKSSGDIHIIGTSAGGAAVFTYLSEAMRGEVPMDTRIRSVITVDSPLGYSIPFRSGDTVNGLLMGFQASAMKTDMQTGLGKWLRAANIEVLTVDTRQDVVGYDALPDIADDSEPVYAQVDTPTMSAYSICNSLPCQVEHFMEFLDLGSTWHIYTGSHMANSARQFIDDHWR